MNHACSMHEPHAIHKWVMRVSSVLHPSYTCFIRDPCAFHPWIIRDAHVNYKWSMRETSAKTTITSWNIWKFWSSTRFTRDSSATSQWKCHLFCAHKTRIDQFYPWSIRDSSVIPMWLRLYNQYFFLFSENTQYKLNKRKNIFEWT